MTEEEKLGTEQGESAAEPHGEAHAAETHSHAETASEGGDAPAAVEHADRFRPEAIAERIAKVGAETDQERAEREAEEHLVARRKSGAAGEDKRSALEVAASKRLAEIGEKAVRRPAPAQAVVLNQDMEPLKGPLKFYEENKRLVQVLGAGVLALVFGIPAVHYWQEGRDTAASVELSAAILAEHGHVEGEEKDKSKGGETKDDLRPTFKTSAERADAALAKFRDVEKNFKGSGAATMAELGAAAILLDKGDAVAAGEAYEHVVHSPLAQADSEIKGRALEGEGFAFELKIKSTPEQKAELLDKALAAYTELEGLDVKGLKELGEYHEARVLEAKADVKGAIEKLKAVRAAVGEPSQRNQFSYLQYVAEERLRALSPADAPPPKRGGPGGLGGMGGGGTGPGGLDMSDPQVQKMVQQYMEQMRKQQAAGGQGLPGVPQPGSAPAPAPQGAPPANKAP